jgi:hypothetical protein
MKKLINIIIYFIYFVPKTLYISMFKLYPKMLVIRKNGEHNYVRYNNVSNIIYILKLDLKFGWKNIFFKKLNEKQINEMIQEVRIQTK